MGAMPMSLTIKKGYEAIYHMSLPFSWLVPLMPVCLVSYMPAGISTETLCAENISDPQVITQLTLA